MPIYVYKCPECNKEVEKLMKFTDPAPKCEDHTDKDMVKQLTAKHKFRQGENTIGGFSSGTLLV